MKREIEDSEIRVIGQNNRDKWRWLYALAALVLIGAITLVLCLSLFGSAEDQEMAIADQEATAVQTHPLQMWLTSLDTIKAQGTVTKDTTANAIPLRIYVPLNSVPRLELGYKVLNRKKENILCFQAADVRADNQKIVGAFVLRGRPLSWGLSKRGYCAIIEDQVTVGVADNSPLFEEATDKDGYFFRQYPLVDKGTLVENSLDNKYIRRALCELEDHIVVVESQTQESLHDFAQALVDIGTTNAIYLVGGIAMGWSCDMDGNGVEIGSWKDRDYRNVSFIVWSR